MKTPTFWELSEFDVVNQTGLVHSPQEQSHLFAFSRWKEQSLSFRIFHSPVWNSWEVPTAPPPPHPTGVHVTRLLSGTTQEKSSAQMMWDESYFCFEVISCPVSIVCCLIGCVIGGPSSYCLHSCRPRPSTRLSFSRLLRHPISDPLCFPSDPACWSVSCPAQFFWFAPFLWLLNKYYITWFYSFVLFIWCYLGGYCKQIFSFVAAFAAFISWACVLYCSFLNAHDARRAQVGILRWCR